MNMIYATETKEDLKIGNQTG